MDLPKPPEDQELRNIIDKLAQFVARNGPEFEHMTKNKQKDNPKFGFLYGGENFNYYQYKVTTEQASFAVLKQKQKVMEQQAIVQHTITQQSIQTAPWQPHIQQQQVQEQIQQSERNLAAQHTVLIQQQQVQIDEAIRKAQDEELHTLAKELEIDLDECDKVMQPVIDSCTKDSISAGKGWIFGHGVSSKHDEVIVKYLLKRVTALGTSFELKLHLVYLINDVLHHCVRKNAEDLKKALQLIVVPVFCTTSIGASDDQKAKLSKLLKLWEANKYFEPTILEQLKSPEASLAAYQTNLITEHASVITPITTSIQTQYAALQKQHQEFVAHITAQLQQQQQQHQLQQQQPLQHPPASFSPLPNPSPVPLAVQHPSTDPETSPGQAPATSETTPIPANSMVASGDQVADVPPASSISLSAADSGVSAATTSVTAASVSSTVPSSSTPQPQPQFPPPQFPPNFNCPPPNFSHPPPFIPNFNQPPPHFQPPPPPNFQPTPPSMGPPPFNPGLPPGMPPGMPPGLPPGFPVRLPPPNQAPMVDLNDPNLLPSVPYFELPAGLMAPLVKLEENEYRPLDPEEIRLPPPAPPSDRLLAAVELFYSPPSHERPRNSEGWEQLGLYEFFKAKSQAKKRKEEELREGF